MYLKENIIRIVCHDISMLY